MSERSIRSALSFMQTTVVRRALAPAALILGDLVGVRNTNAHEMAHSPTPSTQGRSAHSTRERHWSAQELQTLQSLSLASLAPLPPDPSNRVADDVQAADSARHCSSIRD